MGNLIPDEAGWFLDEYDSPRCWGNVNFHGGMPYLGDAVSSLDETAGECWTFGGGDDSSYGRFSVFGRAEPAHRIGYLDFGSKVPPGYEIDHLCRNLSCVRRTHLEAVTHQMNMSRGVRATACACKHGHEYTDENTRYENRNGNRIRRCKTCLRESRQQAYQRRKVAA